MRRLSRLFLLVLSISFIPRARASGQALQTADEIIARYVQRVGGAQRLHAVLSVRRYGHFYGGGGFEAVIAYENARPNKVREEFTFGGLTGVTAFDGKTGWKIEPWAGKKDAEPLGEDEMKGIVEDAEFGDPLFNYKERGNTVSLVGTDQIEGTDVYKLMVTLASNGDVRTYYLDAESCVPVKYEVKRTVRGAERWFEVELGDYKEVQGVLFPFSIAIGTKGSSSADKQQYSWERITVNPVLEERRFTKPAPGEKIVSSENVVQSGTAGPSPASLPAPSPVASAVRARDVTVIADSETIAGLGARNIGSAAMSGRVTSVAAVHEGDRLTVYVGAASGGVWKSNNGGTTFRPMFDKQDVQSIGALAIDPKDPQGHLGRDRRSMDAQLGLGGRRHLQVHRRRRNVDEHGSRGVRAHREDPHRSDEHEHRLRVRAGQGVQRQRRPRRLPDDRRRQDVDEGPRRFESVDGLFADDDGSGVAEDAIRRHVGLPPQGMDVPLRRRRAGQAERERAIQEY